MNFSGESEILICWNVCQSSFRFENLFVANSLKFTPLVFLQNGHTQRGLQLFIKGGLGADNVTFLQIFDSITENIVEKCRNFVVNNFMPIEIIFLSILLIHIFCLIVADNGLVIFILFLVIFVFNLNLIHNFTITNWFASKSFYKISSSLN